MVLLKTEIDLRTIIIFAVFMIVAIIFMYVKSHFDEQKGYDSKEKHMIKDIIRNLMPDGTAVYAIWFESSSSVRIKTTSYWYYAVGFNDNELCVVPLSVEKGELGFSKHFIIKKEDLGMITCVFNNKKNWYRAIFYDKEQRELVKIIVKGTNTKDDRVSPVNIQQQEETRAYGSWLAAWQEEVNRVNNAPVKYKKILSSDCYLKSNKM